MNDVADFNDLAVVAITNQVKMLSKTISLLRQLAQASENELEDHEKRIRKLEDLK